MAVDGLWTGSLQVPIVGTDAFHATFTWFFPSDPGQATGFDAWTSVSQFSEDVNPGSVAAAAFVESLQIGSDTIQLVSRPPQIRWFVQGTVSVTFALVADVIAQEFPTMSSIFGISFWH